MDFYSRISKQYDEVFPLNNSQVSFIKSFSEKNKNEQSLLDIGCGTGSLAISLCDYFAKISAIDTNSQMIASAKKKVGNKKISFCKIGMLEIEKNFPENSFDIVSCFGNTLVHLQNMEEIEAFFRNTKFVLKKTGKFLFQLINYDYVFDSKLKSLPTIENEIIKFERFYSLDENNMLDFSTILFIKETEEIIKNNIKLFPARRKQIIKALQKAGFDTINSYSSFAKTEFNNKSLPLVFECY
ncbi:MAG: class I SAM-dependent methyltransferase [Bacteroidetes bacterium]|jgi:glycine/sarcosine N-methyltransferase|nr:class I SAM-dependent methyltransferase [Bacteroidota bacterium]MBT6686075.1 class I SAM-dependent methyltransferase [Bacteroidota bacterium]MBT7142032.1 class I SAM-dependent methyltransferase [Bacteroidota bacterium]MBT7493582.1 class I SAM-dependent methyltransferase [Bacteroidota bacterium]